MAVQTHYQVVLSGPGPAIDRYAGTLNTTTSNNRRKRSASGRLLGVLGVFWLNLVAAPCAMALGAEHDCPHCPPEQMEAMAAHHGHHGEAAGTNCDGLTADCDDIGTFAHEGRPGQPKLKDKADPAPMAVPPIPVAPPVAVAFVTTAADPPDPAGAFPPLHLLNCVFLD
jgi:hypothetical protein